jgi:hypothetical protein
VRGGLSIKGILIALLLLACGAANAQAWRNCVPNSIGPGGCDSIGRGGGLSIGPAAAFRSDQEADGPSDPSEGNQSDNEVDSPLIQVVAKHLIAIGHEALTSTRCVPFFTALVRRLPLLAVRNPIRSRRPEGFDRTSCRVEAHAWCIVQNRRSIPRPGVMHS